jgi:hypothetical protein
MLLGVVLLLLAIFVTQAWFVLAYPQPPVFGDPAGYLAVGRRLQQAALKLVQGEATVREALGSIRGVLYYAGAGTVFAVFDAWRPGDTTFLRLVFAAFNTLSAFGAFLLARRLSGHAMGGLAALAIYALHPSFAVELASLFPDPVTGCLFVFSAVFFVEGVGRRRAGWMVASGAALGAGLLIRSQLMEYVLALIALGFAVTAPAWVRDAGRRRLAWALAGGLLPFAAGWGVIVHAVGNDLREIEALGNFTFRPRYPYGFWQFLETDGFMGPYRLGTEPYYQEMRADAQQHGWPLASRLERWRFTGRYVAGRAHESLLLVLDNAFRLYDRPPNRYKWDYPFPYPFQVLFHRIAMVMACGALALAVARGTAHQAVFFIPLSLALIHGVSYPWPRFVQPAFPILMAAAGSFVAQVALNVRSLRRGDWVRLGGFVALAAFLAGSGRMLFDAAPAMGATLHLGAALLMVGLPLYLARLLAGRGPRASIAASIVGLVLGVMMIAHTLRGYGWHAVATPLGGEVLGIEQDLVLGPAGGKQLREASEAFLVLDLRVRGGDVSGLTIDLAGRRFNGTDLVPTLPALREFTWEGGPARRAFPQWWALPLETSLRSSLSEGPLRIRMMVPPGLEVEVGGDRFARQHSLYEGPSFGEWREVAGIKFDYDGDARLPVRRSLSSLATTSFVIGRDASVRQVRGVHRVRIVTVGSNEGSIRWETAPAPSRRRVAFVFAAVSRFTAPGGTKGSADLYMDGQPAVTFPLEPVGSYVIGNPRHELCYGPLPDRRGRSYGAYALLTETPAPGRALTLTVRFRSGLDAEQILFRLAPEAPREALVVALRACLGTTPVVNGAARVLDDSTNRYPELTGRFQVTAVF